MDRENSDGHDHDRDHSSSELNGSQAGAVLSHSQDSLSQTLYMPQGKHSYYCSDFTEEATEAQKAEMGELGLMPRAADCRAHLPHRLCAEHPTSTQDSLTAPALGWTSVLRAGRGLRVAVVSATCTGPALGPAYLTPS